jgi:hypothetical protein
MIPFPVIGVLGGGYQMAKMSISIVNGYSIEVVSSGLVFLNIFIYEIIISQVQFSRIIHHTLNFELLTSIKGSLESFEVDDQDLRAYDHL